MTKKAGYAYNLGNRRKCGELTDFTFEKQYPNDNRPRKAIEVAIKKRPNYGISLIKEAK